MRRLVGTFLLVALAVAPVAPRENTRRDPGPRLAPKWSVPVGITNFKSTIVPVGDSVYLGTRGHPVIAGVWRIDGRTGKAKRIFRARGKDNDVAGLAFDGKHLYFGTDYRDVYKITLEGKKVWAADVRYLVRGSPALARLNEDEIPDVVVATAGGEVRALNGETGRRLWRFRTSSRHWQAGEFIASPALLDITSDGVADVLIGARNGAFYAINGKTGKQIWRHDFDYGIHASALVIVPKASKGEVEDEEIDDWIDELTHPDIDTRDRAAEELTGAGLQAVSSLKQAIRKGDKATKARAIAIIRDIKYHQKPRVLVSVSSGRILCLRAEDGRRIWKTHINDWIFASPVAMDPRGNRFIVGTSWDRDENGLYIFGENGSDRFVPMGARVSSSAVVADLFGLGRMAFVGIEDGRLVGVDELARIRWSTRLGGPVECTPCVADIDGDGLLELLVAARDGYLYCFDTTSDRPAVWSGFHGDPFNTRVFRLK